MALIHRSLTANEVRAPAVPRGEVVVVGRYSDKTPKVALVNPEDLAMLEEAHEALQAVGLLEGVPVDALTVRTLEIEDRPSAESVEDPAAIAAFLGL